MVAEENNWELLGYIIASPNRRRVAKLLYNKHLTPAQISKHSGIRIGHISNILSKLKNKGIVVCRNPDAKRGRLYSLTKRGLIIIDGLKNRA
jgi:DNA-binding MarR family transcriptional regulator